MCRTVARFVGANRQSCFCGVAVDQHRMAGRDDMAKYADAARERGADHSVRKIGAGGDFKLISAAFDDQGD